ncbi:autotransporter outer membrane beta-barrel domain-containing protein [Bordetella petrii]|uniref:Autotransporter outer membrane beta-barrel domain-containing protein n=1 Tax=Bordetella petrii TaxID=94624 RepID=A0ABT7W409_9BORD|nr:autotransporter outer membrane beta-barrel domain-containing protein [Bordetella petrii]MDM9559892.1 autotransporter outer membrane beta-barrel domain-containing protein [Bordetella petrii]
MTIPFFKQSARHALAAIAMANACASQALTIVQDGQPGHRLEGAHINRLDVSRDGTVVDVDDVTVAGQVSLASGARLNIAGGGLDIACPSAASCQGVTGLSVQGMGTSSGVPGISTDVAGAGVSIRGFGTGITQFGSSLIDLRDVRIDVEHIGLDLNGSVRKDGVPTITRIGDFDITTRSGPGVYATHGAELHLSNGTIRTTGDGAAGVYLGGGTGGPAPEQTTAHMDDVIVHTRGDGAYGLLSQQLGGGSHLPRGAVSYWTASHFMTEGNQSHGVVADFSWNTVALDASSISTAGDQAAGIWSRGRAAVSLLDSSVTTMGAGAHGAVVEYGGKVALDESSVHARGAGAHGIFMQAGVAESSDGQRHGSQVVLQGSHVRSEQGYGIAAAGGHLAIDVLGGSMVQGAAGLLDVQDYTGGAPRWDQGITTVDLLADGGSVIAGRVQTAATAVSNITLQGGSIWQVNGDSNVTTLVNRHSTVQFVPAATAPGGFSTLRVAGNYVGDGGTIIFNAALAGDGSPSDRLVIDGDVSGQTFVKVLNRGGLGADTQDGIRIIEVAGQSPADAFALQHDYVAALGRPAIVVGAYGYSLYQGGVADPDDGNWYLRSEYINAGKGPGGNPTPLYQPGAPLYESYANVLHELNALPTLRERVGQRRFAAASMADGASAEPRSGSWGRVQGAHSRFQSGRSTTGARQDLDISRMQLGADWQAYASPRGYLILGINAHYDHASSDIRSVFGRGKVHARGHGVGGTLTWYGRNGLYVDAQARVSWFDGDLSSRTLGVRETSGNDGRGYALGLEAGRSLVLNDRWALTPQAQLLYSHVDYDDFRDAYRVRVSLLSKHRVAGRLGVSADYRLRLANGNALDAYGIVNLHQIFSGAARTRIADVALAQASEHTWAGVGFGASYSWGRGAYMVHGSADIRTSLQGLGDSYGAMGTLGARIRF